MPTKTAPALPRIAPIVPVSRPAAFNDPAWLFEPKYDGFRGMVYLTRQSCSIYSKRGNRFSRFEDLRRRICAELPRREVILDGEVVAIDDEGRVSFMDLMRTRGYLAFAAFDLLWLNGRDLRQMPLTQRKKRLERLIPATTGTLLRVPCFEEHGRDLFEAACRLDLEGIVAKRKRDAYGPRTAWYKVKNPTYTQAEGRYQLFERRQSPSGHRRGDDLWDAAERQRKGGKLGGESPAKGVAKMPDPSRAREDAAAAVGVSPRYVPLTRFVFGVRPAALLEREGHGKVTRRRSRKALTLGPSVRAFLDMARRIS